MKFTSFLKDKILQIVLLFCALCTIQIFLIIYDLGIYIKIYIPLVISIVYFVGIIVEYYIKNKYYKKLFKTLDKLEDKYLISEIISNASFFDGKILKEVLEQIDKSMHENVNKYKYLQEDYKEYIEMWIHEIKIPLATSKMIVENNKNDITKSIDEELEKIENYIEQALYYARSNTVEKDYIIRKSNLKDIINEVIIKNKSAFIQEKILINVRDVNVNVNTDSKWIVFILNQIIQNSIKYRKKELQSKIEIMAKVNKENIVLYIKDNGLGIKKGEVDRVFEKGFTGTNGRVLNKKSTGIGLYLCRKLCDKLGIKMKLSSIYNEGTEIKLIFPNSSYINLTEM